MKTVGATVGTGSLSSTRVPEGLFLVATDTECTGEAGGLADPVSSPIVSVIMANYNGAAYIEDALCSATRQTLQNIEIIIVDDGSTDDSVERVQTIARDDQRIRIIQTACRAGPGGARNLGITVARGTWIAIQDSDDLMHPRRLADLVYAASVDGVQIIADNQLVFDHARAVRTRPLLSKRQLPVDGRIHLEAYIDSNSLSSRASPLGYLKPLFLRSFMERTGSRYNTTMPIAEDYDLVLQLLLAGARFRVLPQMTYFYRRHSGSTSHRLSAATLVPMLGADTWLRSRFSSADTLTASVVAALERRRKSISRAIGFEELVGAIKERGWVKVVRIAAHKPGSVALLRGPVQDRLRRFVQRKPQRSTAISPERCITLLSRQRIVGTTNGSSAYLLSVCTSLRNAGYEIDLISPSPAMFGRWPFLRLDPSMELFRSISVRGSFRFGRIIIARDPRIALRAGGGMMYRLLSALNVKAAGLDRKAPHAVAVPLTDADRLFIADTVRRSDAILTDYAFLNESIPFALQPRIPTAVVMHDLFFAQDQEKTVVLLDKDQELLLLDQADAVVAIQDEEASTIRKLLPHKHVILAPMAVYPVAEVQPGDDGIVLFIGSKTQPNIEGISWFLDKVWPDVLARCPEAQVWIAGSCCGSLPINVRNVKLLGRIDELDDVYRKAGVVISPLRLGSGLKIKLIEAIGRGKAVIATETTLQGVKSIMQGAVLQADTSRDFTEALVSLLHDRATRSQIGARALEVARKHFSPESCYAGLIEFLQHTSQPGESASRRALVSEASSRSKRVLSQ
ncbi:glycosyltransferase [Lichenicola cladoniae]|uniref:Glycosyltransferase n=1 Tax=Lichenicola cladoniae TaxID=1484109 RepID=A0A6M8HGH1_9PROT|nr:glycosyltransferase [Lichenicola cladoniae]NPD65158.1 glycosyltransferase [Acetobacteraceae bacterium]QKE88762.1 glycosyltransferase [Lichenicola cladoniae]